MKYFTHQISIKNCLSSQIKHFCLNGKKDFKNRWNIFYYLYTDKMVKEFTDKNLNNFAPSMLSALSPSELFKVGISNVKIGNNLMNNPEINNFLQGFERNPF